MSHAAFIALGSNLEDPRAQVIRGFSALAGLPGTQLLARSSLYASAPVGYADQPDFVNAVAKISTDLSPQDLLQALLKIEHQNGRERTFQNAPRTLDLDVLLYDDLILNSLAKVVEADAAQGARHGATKTYQPDMRPSEYRATQRCTAAGTFVEHGLTIPHPQMHKRAFVLQPLLEIAPDCVIPGIGKASVAAQACQDQTLQRMDEDRDVVR